MVRLRLPLFLAISLVCLLPNIADGSQGEPELNVKENDASAPPATGGTNLIDESWPTQSVEGFLDSTTNHAQREHYTKYMNGCYEALGRDLCNKNERDRLGWNTLQPALMKNFTTLGYAKMETPAETHELLIAYLEKFQDNLDSENWARQTGVNHWQAPTDVHDIELFMPLEDRQTIRQQIRENVEKWSGVPLTPVAMYGIRVYRKDSILVPHVDRLPLVLSAIINVDQEQDGEEWPLQVIGHDGNVANLTLKAGEMILYESHSVIHGRPYPLKKWYYASLFLHFEPLGYSYELKQDLQKGAAKTPVELRREKARVAFDKALEKQKQMNKPKPKMAAAQDVPFYVTPETEQELRWKQNFIFQREPRKPFKPQMTVGATAAHTVAANGDLEALKEEVDKDPSVLNQADVNGWKPLHEAARGGQTKVLEYLIEKGVDINERTHNGKGGSPLWWAERNFPPNHPSVVLLKKNGGESLPPRD